MTIETVQPGSLNVDKLSVLTADGGVRFYTRDDDLGANVRDALRGDPHQSALVLLKLGIDDLDSAEAVVDYYLGPYDDNPVNVLDAAIETLTVLREQLAAIRGRVRSQPLDVGGRPLRRARRRVGGGVAVAARD